MNQAAAIKRATQQARNAMYDLDKRGMAELLSIYEQAVAEIKGKLAAAVDAANLVPVYQLQDLLRQVELIVDGLASRRNDLVIAAIDEAATLGVRPFTAQGVLAVGGSDAVLTSAAAAAVHGRAVQFVMEFVYPDELTLSDRLWRLDRGAKEALTRQIGLAVVQGQSATTAAQRFIMDGQPVPADVEQRLKNARLPQLLKGVDLLANPNGGDGYWQAERVMRTEINRAHGEAFMAAGEETPGFGGWRYLLSPLHPQPDICLVLGTLVTTATGDVPIEHVKVGDHVLTHQGRFKPVVRLYHSQTGPGNLVQIQAGHSRNLPAVMTPNHPVLTLQGWTPAGDLKTGDQIICLQPGPCARHARLAARDGGTKAQGFAQSGPAQGQRTSALARHGAGLLLWLRNMRTSPQTWQLPSLAPTSDAGKARSLWSRRPIVDCHPGGATPTCIFETQLCAETGPDAACRNSGLLRQRMARMPWSNISDRFCSCLKQSSSGRSGTPAAWWRAFFGSKQQSKNFAPDGLPSTAPLQTPCRTRGSQAEPACHDFSTGQSTHDCKTAWWPSAFPAPTGPGWVSRAWSIVHRALFGACAHHMALTPTHAIVDNLPTPGEPVFNFEVEDDHSYVANGLVVHNCDLLSTQNLHGLGAGVYPDRESVPWPAHPNTLSFLEIVFKSEITDADRAGKETALQALQRLAPDRREGALGKTKAEYFDRGLLRTGMIRAPLQAVEQRLRRQGKLS